jgi:hypothetical protein
VGRARILVSARTVLIAAPFAICSVDVATGVAGVAGTADAAVGLEKAALAGAAARIRAVADAWMAVVLSLAKRHE